MMTTEERCDEGVVISGVRLEMLESYSDARGDFRELFRASTHPERFQQSNHSHSKQGVLRGLHYHRYQADLWYVVRGSIRVGLADLREHTDSPVTQSFIMSGDDPRTLYIPPGVAHGFFALTDADLIYLVTQEYDSTDEHGIAWDDPSLNLGWGAGEPVLSDRDAANPPLRWNDIPAFW